VEVWYTYGIGCVATTCVEMRSLALKMITLGVLRWFCFRILNDLTVVAERLRRVCVKSVVVR
jgi:hypothetical protein